MNKKIVAILDINSIEELEELTKTFTEEYQFMAKKVIIEKLTYLKAGEPFDKKENDIYQLMRRIYKKKFGDNYAQREKQCSKNS